MERSSTLAFQLSSKLLVITLRPFFFSSRMSNRKSLYLFTPVKRCRQNDRGYYVETAGLGREEKKKDGNLMDGVSSSERDENRDEKKERKRKEGRE